MNGGDSIPFPPGFESGRYYYNPVYTKYVQEMIDQINFRFSEQSACAFKLQHIIPAYFGITSDYCSAYSACDIHTRTLGSLLTVSTPNPGMGPPEAQKSASIPGENLGCDPSRPLQNLPDVHES